MTASLYQSGSVALPCFLLTNSLTPLLRPADPALWKRGADAAHALASSAGPARHNYAAHSMEIPHRSKDRALRSFHPAQDRAPIEAGWSRRSADFPDRG